MKTMIERAAAAAILALFLVFVPGAASAQPPQSPAQEGFVPVDQLPGQEEMPAVPLVATAYGFAWAAVLIYVFTVWRRVGAVEREMTELSRRLETRSRS